MEFNVFPLDTSDLRSRYFAKLKNTQLVNRSCFLKYFLGFSIFDPFPSGKWLLVIHYRSLSHGFTRSTDAESGNSATQELTTFKNISQELITFESISWTFFWAISLLRTDLVARLDTPKNWPLSRTFPKNWSLSRAFLNIFLSDQPPENGFSSSIRHTQELSTFKNFNFIIRFFVQNGPFTYCKNNTMWV